MWVVLENKQVIVLLLLNFGVYDEKYRINQYILSTIAERASVLSTQQAYIDILLSKNTHI
jgi:hypothetical protein